MSISQIDSLLCNGCGLCVNACPQNVTRLDTAPAGKEELPACASACPAGVNTRRYTHLLTKSSIFKDGNVCYYRTLSGSLHIEPT